MGCAEEKIIAKLKCEEDIPAFCDSWRKRLGEGDLLSCYDKDADAMIITDPDGILKDIRRTINSLEG